MKQAQYSPMSVAEMAVSLYAVDNGYMDDIDLVKIGAFEAALLDFMKNTHTEFMDRLNHGDWTDELQAELKSSCDDFKATGSW
jgi:F-type H+-transporting ATPase subunit alpha